MSNPGSKPVSTAAITFTGGTVATDAAGHFTLSGSSTGTVSVRVSVSAAGYVTRDTYVSGGSDRPGVVIDLIANAPPFSMAFYKELVRGVLDGGPVATRRWQRDPAFYIRTVDENGAAVPQWLIDDAVSVVPDIVADVTAGRYHPTNIDTGTAMTSPPPGSILVKFPAAYFGAAGQATNTGADPCTVQVWQGDVRAAVPYVIAHEIAHCLGLYHITVTGRPPTAEGLMGKNGPGSWNLPRLTDLEKFHAAILYSRPVGNTDPDVDPPSWLFSRTGWNGSPGSGPIQ